MTRYLKFACYYVADLIRFRDHHGAVRIARNRTMVMPKPSKLPGVSL